MSPAWLGGIALTLCYAVVFMFGIWKGDRDARADASRVVCSWPDLDPEYKAQMSARILHGPGAPDEEDAD